MTSKKTLENRIRGWFPKEPAMISKRFNVYHESKQPPLMIPSNYKLSATKFAGAFAIYWIIFYGFIFYFVFFSFNIYSHPVSEFQIVTWIILGLTGGVISNAIVTKNQLSRLSKDYQFNTNGKDMVLLIVPMVLVFGFGGFVSWFLYSSLQVWGILIYCWGVSFCLTRVLLFVALERKENMRLMQSWWGTNIFLVPKAPNNKENGYS
jgi:hypothetical protein